MEKEADEQIEENILDWLVELRKGTDSDKLRIIGEVLVGIYANTYETALQGETEE